MSLPLRSGFALSLVPPRERTVAAEVQDSLTSFRQHLCCQYFLLRERRPNARRIQETLGTLAHWPALLVSPGMNVVCFHAPKQF